MADPKYANLPGIAHDEPDVYETSDLPESEQTSDFYEEESDVVEKLNIPPNEAFIKYEGKLLNANKVDFSERISRNICSGYAYELVGLGEKETVLQKYQRLQCEMGELLEEVNTLKSSNKDGSNVLTPQQVEQALRKLTELKLEETLGEEMVSNINDPQGAQIKKLMAQLDQFKAKAADMPESDRATDGITFQLNYKPEQAHLAQTNRLAELERRLSRLETVLGASNEKLTRLSSLTSKPTLLEAAQHLSATASMLDSSQLDHIEGRLTALAQKLESIAEIKKEIIPDPEGDKKINELYDLVKGNEKLSELLPATIERLKSLEGLHVKAAEFTKTLTQIEKLHDEVTSNVNDNKDLIKGVQASFANNLNEINKTVINLDARIKQFKKT